MRGLRSGQFVKAMVIAGVVEVVGVVLTLVISFVTKTAPATWGVVLVPVTAVLLASVKAGVDAAAKAEPKPVPVPAPGGYTTYGGGVYGPSAPQQAPAQQARGGVSLVVVLAVLLVICGGGGLAVFSGVKYGYGWVTGNEPGTTVFQGEVSGSAGNVTVTVTEVLVTAHFTKVALRAENTGQSSVSLPVFGFCQLVGADGQTLDGDPTRTDLSENGWSEEVPPNVPHRGVIAFTGRLSPGKATLSFSTVFGPGGGGALVVRGIPIRAP